MDYVTAVSLTLYLDDFIYLRKFVLSNPNKTLVVRGALESNLQVDNPFKLKMYPTSFFLPTHPSDYLIQADPVPRG